MNTGIPAGVMLVVLTAVAPAAAQARRSPREPRSFVAVDGGVHSVSAVTDQFTVEQNAEDGTIRARYPGNTAGLVDVSAGMRIWQRIGIGAGVTRVIASGDAAVTAEVPHPFFFDRHRPVDGTATDLSRDETGVHVQVYWEPRLTGRLRLRAFAGPSFIHVEQDLVEGVEVNESYPFDEATFRSARTVPASGSGLGGHAGVDLAWMLSRQLGAGFVLRYSRANVDLNAPASRTVSSDGGGFQAGIGVRAVF